MTKLSPVSKLLLITLLSAALFVRFYNFADRVNFGPEQAISLDYAARLRQRPSLLGQPSFRTTSTGLTIFHGPQFSYSLIPLLLIANFDPLPITAYFALLNWFTGLLLFIWAANAFGIRLALLSSFLFLFSAPMIDRSLNLWIIDYWPLLGLLQLICLYSLFRHPHHRLSSLGLGFFSSLAVAFDYLAIPPFFLSLLAGLYLARPRHRFIFLFAAGAVLGSLPTLVFDLRHQFYHLQTLWRYLLDVVDGKNAANLSLFHFFQFWPLLTLLGGRLLSRLVPYKPVVVLLLLTGYLYLNLSSTQPPPVKLSTWYRLSSTIAQDAPASYNLATLLDFDTRSHPLRYLLTYRHRKPPLGVVDYTPAESLYVIARPRTDVLHYPVWEINSFAPTTVARVWDIGDNLIIYKLTRG